MGQYLSFHLIKHKESGQLLLTYNYIFHHIIHEISQVIKGKENDANVLSSLYILGSSIVFFFSKLFDSILI